VKEIGYCADASLPTLTIDETAKFSDVTTYIYGKLQGIAETPVWSRDEAISREIAGIYSKYFAWGIERKLKLLDLESLRSIVEKNPQKPYVIIREVFFPNCVLARNRSSDLAFESCESDLYADSNRIHELLDTKNPLPIPFAYCSKVLIKGKEFNDTFPVGKNCGIHWSLIAGRKKIAGECFLLVRNSWRPGVKYSTDWIVENGDIWVREKELLHSMLLVQWLKE